MLGCLVEDGSTLDAERFGAIVKQLREQRGWTKQKLAQRAGITPTYMGILEYGGNVPTLPTILELMEVLGADIGDVMRRLAAARVSAPPVLPRKRRPPKRSERSFAGKRQSVNAHFPDWEINRFQGQRMICALLPAFTCT
jgi:transcriptional regulator with XRE-family HTH domain